MNCTSCQHDNAASARFCSACGVRLERSCSGCGAPLAEGARFCSQCGQPAEEAAAASAEVPRESAGERRQLTVMFADLVGSTELAHRLDPEDLQEVIAAYQDTCSGVVKRFEGHVAQFLGDGVLVYFGFPLAHEDDAERAVRAALEIQASLARLNAERRARGFGESGESGEIAARIGIHTGPVVVSASGEDAQHQPLALGVTVNVLDSIELWHRFRSPWMELRSELSLARLRLRTGRKNEARERLAALYAQFSEGFETKRLQDARQLLDQLA